MLSDAEAKHHGCYSSGSHIGLFAPAVGISDGMSREVRRMKLLIASGSTDTQRRGWKFPR
jgi:hypothetical protein